MTFQGWSRRRWLQAAGAAGSIFAPSPWAWTWAQSDGAARLLRVAKDALVIGNAAYRHVPALANPGNDARAIAAALGEAGFTVRTVLDAERAAMAQAIQEWLAGVASRKSVGLFYFAGHGVQLAWRNYLLPVDASPAGIQDVPRQCVDVSTVVDGIKRAANPMNVIILDACRDNPFGAEQKGLSQMDAPPATLLAYATAPGNMASDGSGANGLYTEKLVKEMRVREAKIEDVFKRVRLAVRLASRGTQIPWESTSLEEDFYFIPPPQLVKQSRDEEARAFAEEREAFEKAGSAAALEAYLRRYPSGRFAELAQLFLDRELAAQGEKRVEAAPAEGNPNSQGSARANTAFKVGDWYAYRVADLRRGTEQQASQTVTSVGEREIVLNFGRALLDPLGNAILLPDGRRFTPRQDVPLEYVVGKRWSTRFDVVAGGTGTVNLDFRITAKDRITVPAGTFDCFRIEGSGINESPFHPPVSVSLTYWRDPARVRRAIVVEEKRYQRGSLVASERRELISWHEG